MAVPSREWQRVAVYFPAYDAEVTAPETTGSELSPRQECLVRVAAALASRSPEALTTALRGALEVGAEVETEEILVQSYLFLGYPVALSGMARWREVSGRPAPEPRSGGWNAWALRGAQVLERVYGEQHRRLRDNVRRLHPDLEHWMVTEGYGKVLGREGVALLDRELAIVAQLAVLDVPRQLYSHLRGSLHVGASEPQVERVLAVAAEYGPDSAAAAEAVWRQLLNSRSPGANREEDASVR